MNATSNFPAILFCPHAEIGFLVVDHDAELTTATRRYFGATLQHATEIIDSEAVRHEVTASLGAPVAGASGFSFSSGGRPSLLPSRHYTVNWTRKKLESISLDDLKRKVHGILAGGKHEYWQERVANDPELPARVAKAESVRALIRALG